MFKKLEAVAEKYDELTRLLADPSISDRSFEYFWYFWWSEATEGSAKSLVSSSYFSATASNFLNISIIKDIYCRGRRVRGEG